MVMLLDLFITLAIIGIVTLIALPKFSQYLAMMRNLNHIEQERAIKTIEGVVLQYAASIDPKGRAPAPYTGGGYFSAPADPSNTQLMQLMDNSNIMSRQINDDGKGSRNVRVYQLDAGHSATVPLYSQSGPLVTLIYDVGVMYQTACAFGVGCATAAVPGVSPTFTESVASTWKPTYPDFGGQQFSTYPIQLQKLRETARRLDRIRDGLQTYYHTANLAAAANDLSNYYPPTTAPLGGQNPASNQGCRDGWYPLDAAGGYTTILGTLGLGVNEYGVTDWGGRIEFCRKYDPTGTTANTTLDATPPHYAALRINKNVTTGANPTNVATDNVLLTF
jgi:hypothetical protein